MYVDELGEICAVSPQFTFSAPKPLDELVTLEEERNGEEENEGDDLLLVVPRAQILQVKNTNRSKTENLMQTCKTFKLCQIYTLWSKILLNIEVFHGYVLFSEY